MLAMYAYYKVKNRVESECFGLIFLFYYSIFQMSSIRTKYLLCAVSVSMPDLLPLAFSMPLTQAFVNIWNRHE